MQKNNRINDTKAAANDCETNLPWARGLRRQAMIARRLEADTSPAKISLAPMPSFMLEDISV